MENVNDTFFDGYYKDIWRHTIPEKMTDKEVAFIIDYFDLRPGSSVLDLMCGYGRHAIALAKNHIYVTAVDNLPSYIDEIQQLVNSYELPVKAICSNILDYQPTEKFDLAICMGNSLNFFNEKDTRQIISKLSNSIKKQGYLLIHSWSVTEIAVHTFKPQSVGRIGQFKMESQTEFLFQPTRIQAETKIINEIGDIEIKKAVDYIFSISEYEHILADYGFKIKAMYSIPGKKHFEVGDPRLYVVAVNSGDHAA